MKDAILAILAALLIVTNSKNWRGRMKDAILAILAAFLIVTNLKNLFLDQEIEKQAEWYETRLEVQEMNFRDEMIEVQEEHQRDKDELAKVRLELSGKQFEFDMATNRVEQLNKEIGGTAYESK